MVIYESIKLALRSIASNKLRSFLTLVGIGVGLFSIIIVMTSITAIQTSFEDVFNSIGTNNFIINKYPAIRTPGSWRKYRNREDLEIEQGEKLRQLADLPAAIGIEVSKSGTTVKFGKESTNPNVTATGMNLDVMVTSDLVIDEGRGFTQQDMIYARNVCIIGNDIKEKLFSSISPIGQEIRVDNASLVVIGTFEKKGSVLGQGQDNFLAMPLHRFTKYFGKHRSANFTIMAETKELFTKTQDQVITVLRTIRKVKPGEENDFEIVTNDQLISEFNNITQYFKIGSAIVAFIALIAAGVGIMNIMLVSVTERTKEIGIRKAIGARSDTIRFQFLIEAVVLSQVGGLLGILFGVMGGNLVAVYLGVSLVVPFTWILLGLLITTSVGVIFGVYPAIKASNLDPIEALRYE